MEIEPIFADKPVAADNTVAGKSMPDQVTSQSPPEPSRELPAAEARGEAPRKRIPLASIPTTIIVGLLIAAIYLGGRIFTARGVSRLPPIHNVVPGPPPRVASPAKIVSQQPAPSPVEKAAPEAQHAPLPASAAPPAGSTDDDGLPMIQPRPGERYIQVGALDPDARDTRRFVEKLRREGLDPHVAAGPIPALMRVLIGPFASEDALNEKKAQIESEGVDTFVREY